MRPANVRLPLFIRKAICILAGHSRVTVQRPITASAWAKFGDGAGWHRYQRASPAHFCARCNMLVKGEVVLELRAENRVDNIYAVRTEHEGPR